MTPFRKSQARAVLEGLVRALAPEVCSLSSLQAAVRSVADDPALWRELEVQQRKRIASELPAVPRAATVETSSVMEVGHA